MKMLNQREDEMETEYDVKVGQEYDLATGNGKRFTISIESEDENYFFVSMGTAGLGVPKSEINSLLNQNQAVLVKDWD